MSSSSWSDHLALKSLNVLSFILFFGSSAFVLTSGEYGEGRETLITPSTWVLALAGGLINTLLLGYVIYQFFDYSHDAIHGVGYRFALVGVLQSIFVHTFASGHYIVAFVFSLLVASSVSTVYYSLAANYPPKGLADQLWVHLPFSLWHSYSIITAFISAFALFTPERHHVGFTLKVITMITLGLLATTGYGYAFQSRRGDVAGAAVIALYLYGVFEHQKIQVIHYFSLGAFVVTFVAVAKSLFFTLKSDDRSITLGGDSERAPLIG